MTANYAGPFYDIYQVFDQTTMGGVSSSQPKLYYFSSDQQRLARVRYSMRVLNSSLATPVDVQLSGWTNVAGQLVPTTIQRKEHGSQVWVLDLSPSSAAISARANDGIFTRPF